MLSAQRASCPRHRCGPHPGAHACTHAGKQGSVQPSLTVAFSNCGGRAGGGAAGGAGAAGARRRWRWSARRCCWTRAPGVAWEDIAGQEPAKRLVQELVVWPMLNPHLFQACRPLATTLGFSTSVTLPCSPSLNRCSPSGRKLDLCCQSACAPDCMGRSMPLAGPLQNTSLECRGV